jgi:hypothetical protein
VGLGRRNEVSVSAKHSYLYHGMVLELRTPEGQQVHIRRRGATAIGDFYIRERHGGLYVEYRYFERGSGFPTKVYVGRVDSVD